MSEDGGSAGFRRSALLLLGAGAGAAVLTLLHVPAGAIVGAVLGSAAVNTVHPGRSLGRPLRVGGLVLLGAVAGVRLNEEGLRTLVSIAVPLVLAAVALLVLAALLAAVLTRRFGLDPVTATFACVPGGASEVVLVAEEAGARAEVVLAIHLVRVLLVVLVVLPALVLLLGAGA